MYLFLLLFYKKKHKKVDVKLKMTWDFFNNQHRVDLKSSSVTFSIRMNWIVFVSLEPSVCLSVREGQGDKGDTGVAGGAAPLAPDSDSGPFL